MNLEDLKQLKALLDGAVAFFEAGIPTHPNERSIAPFHLLLGGRFGVVDLRATQRPPLTSDQIADIKSDGFPRLRQRMTATNHPTRMPGVRCPHCGSANVHRCSEFEDEGLCATCEETFTTFEANQF